MNTKDTPNSLDNATVDELMAADFGIDNSHRVARRLAETKAAYAALDMNPEASKEVDVAIADADAELGLDDGDSSHDASAIVVAMPTPDRRLPPPPDVDEDREPIKVARRSKPKARLKPAVGAARGRRLPRTARTLIPAYMTTVALSLIIAAVLLGTFANIANTGLALAVSAPAGIWLLTESILRAYLLRSSVRESGAKTTLELLLRANGKQH